MKYSKQLYSILELRKNFKAFYFKNSIKNEIGYDGIYHYHIRKTGGTSINTAFLKLYTVKDSIYHDLNIQLDNRLIINNHIYITNNKLLAEYTPYFYAFAHRPSHKLNISKNKFLFTCLRSPIDRMFSHYNMIKTSYEKNENRYDYKDLYQCLGNNICDFVNNLPKELVLEQIYMFSKNYNTNEAFDNIMNLNAVLLTEHLTEGFLELKEKLNLPLNYIHTRKANVITYLNNDEKDFLISKLTPEIELYNKILEIKLKEYNIA
ncbi:MAG TPA: sulfotransferase family 2 domain-containing protein [Vicingaceae bacterium]|nr:sulfotransferase family 2 domain-containing protein [Vicingaceae bacterium]